MTKVEAALRLQNAPLNTWGQLPLEVAACGGAEQALAIIVTHWCVTRPAYFRKGARLKFRHPFLK